MGLFSTEKPKNDKLKYNSSRSAHLKKYQTQKSHDSEQDSLKIPGNNLVTVTNEDQEKLISILKTHTEQTSNSMSRYVT